MTPLLMTTTERQYQFTVSQLEESQASVASIGGAADDSQMTRWMRQITLDAVKSQMPHLQSELAEFNGWKGIDCRLREPLDAGDTFGGMEHLLDYYSAEEVLLLTMLKLVTDILFLAVLVLSIVALWRPLRFWLMKTRFRAGCWLAVSVIWITAWFWLPVAYKGMELVSPVEVPAPPPPPPAPYFPEYE